MATYEGKSDRDLLIELYTKFESMEKEIGLLTAGFNDYRQHKSKKIEKMETQIRDLQDWKVAKQASEKITITIASVLGLIGGGIANILMQIFF